MINFKLSDIDNNCTNCPLKKDCGRDIGADVCARMFVFFRALSVSNLSPSECVPFNPIVAPENIESFRRLQNISRNIYEFVSEGNNLLLMGPTGTGKTRSAIKLMLNYLAYMSKIKQSRLIKQYEDETFIPTIYVLRAMDVYMTMLDMDKYKDIRRKVFDADIVLIDDIGNKSMTDAMSARYFDLIDARNYSNKCTIYTSNLNGRDLNELLDERITSRMHTRLTTIKLLGDDMRVEEQSKW